jgi:hypothetical protein
VLDDRLGAQPEAHSRTGELRLSADTGDPPEAR